MLNIFKSKKSELPELSDSEIKGVELPNRVIELESESLPQKELHEFARTLSDEEIKNAKKHFIDFYDNQSPEYFCSRIEETIQSWLGKAEKLAIKFHEDYYGYYKTSQDITKGTDFFDSINETLDEVVNLEKVYKKYIDTLDPEMANVYDFPTEIDLGGRYKEKIENLLSKLKFIKEISSKVEKEKEIPSSFYTLTRLNEKSGKKEYKIFTQDSEGNNILEVNSNDSFNERFKTQYTDNIDFSYTDYDNFIKYFKPLPSEQLKLVAKIMELYDIPEFANRLVNFEDFIENISSKLKNVKEVKNKYRFSLYSRRRDFLRIAVEKTNKIRQNVEADHKQSIGENIDIRSLEVGYH